MAQEHTSRVSAFRPGAVLHALCLVIHVLYLALLIYCTASDILFVIQVGMMTFTGLVLTTLFTAVGIAGSLLVMPYAVSCLRRGMRDARSVALFPTHIMGMVFQLVYEALGIVLLFLPFFQDTAAAALQIYFSVFFFLLAELAALVAVTAAADIRKAKPAKRDRPGPQALWAAAKKPVLFGVVGAVSIAYIFSGEHSMVSLHTEAFEHFTAAELSGAPADESLFAGSDLTLINIWATFCGPCLGEMPDLAQLHEEYGDRGFQVVGVCADIIDPQTGALIPTLYEKALELEQQTGADVYRDLNPAGDIQNNYINAYVSAYPTSVFVNAKGEQVGDMIVGSCSRERWINEIEQRLAMVEAESAS